MHDSVFSWANAQWPFLFRRFAGRRNMARMERRSLRKIAAELAVLGHLNVNCRPYSAKSVRSMIEGPARMRQLADPT